MGSGLEGFTGKWVTICVGTASTLYALQGSQLFLIQQRIISCFDMEIREYSVLAVGANLSLTTNLGNLEFPKWPG
jgi:hypothetical protein